MSPVLHARCNSSSLNAGEQLAQVACVLDKTGTEYNEAVLV